MHGTICSALSQKHFIIYKQHMHWSNYITDWTHQTVQTLWLCSEINKTQRQEKGCRVFLAVSVVVSYLSWSEAGCFFDWGIYVCVADKEQGVFTQKIHWSSSDEEETVLWHRVVIGCGLQKWPHTMFYTFSWICKPLSELAGFHSLCLQILHIDLKRYIKSLWILIEFDVQVSRSL